MNFDRSIRVVLSFLLVMSFCVVSVEAQVISSSAKSETPVLVAGTMDGSVYLVDMESSETLSTTNISGAVAQIDIFDPDSDGEDEVIVIPNYDGPTNCLTLSTLEQEWTTSHDTMQPRRGREHFGSHSWCLDIDNDGSREMVISHENESGGRHYNVVQIFNGENGQRENMSGETLFNSLPYAIVPDPDSSGYLICGVVAPNASTHYLYAYDATGDFSTPAWTNTSVNMYMINTVSMNNVELNNRIFGGWMNRTLYVVDNNGDLQWSDSFSGSYEAQAWYAGDLVGDGTETLIVGGACGAPGTEGRLEAVKLSDGTIIWEHYDPDAQNGLYCNMIYDCDGNGVKEVFAHSKAGDGSGESKYMALDGNDGSLLWEAIYPTDVWATGAHKEAKAADVDGDGTKEVILMLENTVQVRDPLSGNIIKEFEFGSTATTIETTTLSTNGALTIQSATQNVSNQIEIQYDLTPHSPAPAGGYDISVLARNTDDPADTSLPDADYDDVTAYVTGDTHMPLEGGSGTITWDVAGMPAGALRDTYYIANVDILFRLKAIPVD